MVKIIESDRKWWRKNGYASYASDLAQLESAADEALYVHHYIDKSDGMQVDKVAYAQQVIKLLGREGWLRGIARCAFHWNAIIDINGTDYVYFQYK